MRVRAEDTATMPREGVLQAISEIAGSLRQADLNEALAATGEAPAAILRQSFELSSHSWLIFDRAGRPIAIFGVAPGAVQGMGVVWMLGTDGLEREWVGVARQTKRYLADMHRHYHILWNYIDARNELSLNWLLRSGFHLIDADPAYGHEKRLFYEFARLG